VVTALIDRLGPDEEAFLADFAEQARILTPWTTDRAALVRALERVRGNAFTGLYDAVNETIRMARTGVHARKVLLVVSDGHDTSSERSARQAREAIRGSEVVVYALALQEAGGGRRINAGALRNLTDETSGRTEIVVGSQNLEGAIARLADELGQQYVLGYAPPAGPAAQWHEIKVEVPRRDVTIHTRRGYVSR
jgi:VWFA-related protein